MTRHGLTALLLLFAIASTARQLTPEQALHRLMGEGARNISVCTPSAGYRLAYTSSEDGVNLLYVMNKGDGGNGFCILSADDCAPALLGYSDNGSFLFDEMPDGLRWWLSQYKSDIMQAIRLGVTLDRMSSIEHDPIGILVESKWGQDAPFNMLCNDNGYSAPTGCVATAMSQLMRYHQWPVVGTGSKSYYDETSGKEVQIQSDFSQHAYDWSSMEDLYQSSATGTSSEAVALLMKDCGVSVEMSYGKSSSGANGYLVPYAMMQYFGYTKAMQNCPRAFYSDSDWEQLILSELEQNRPLLYMGHTVKNEGHAFVLDGYLGDGYFHFNWGWNGQGDGYYVVTGEDALKPSFIGTGGGTMGLGYTQNQCIITEMRKAETGETYKRTAKLGFPSGYSVSAGHDTLYVNAPFWNYGTASSDSKMAVGIRFSSGTSESVIQSGQLGRSLAIGHGFSNFTLTYKSTKSFTGEYTVEPVFSTTYKTVTDVFGNQTTVYSDWQSFLLPPDYEYAKVSYSGKTPTVVDPGGPTAINEVQQAASEAPSTASSTYDITGRRVSDSSISGSNTHGLYIHNSHKVIR